jgi:S1-C subfamily serine protease
VYLSALVRADDVVRQAEQQRIDVISRVSECVVCILTPDKTSGGSGVIIADDGYGVTNFHVIAPLLKSRRGLGGLSDGKTHPLEVLGVDPTGDLAMFRLTGRERFVPAALGDSDAIRVGDEVIALGNPFMLAEDYQPTATFGIISGLHRYQQGAEARTLLYTDCIQIDASINPGNSGGPLFDLQGRLIGINGRASFKNQDLLKQRINVGVAYAISINQVKRFVPALREGWLVEHGSLGATVNDTLQGVVFDRILPGSAAAGAGLKVGDQLLEFDQRPIASANAFASVLGVYPAGWPIGLRFRRDGQESTRQVTLDPLAFPGELPFAKADPAWITQRAAGAIRPGAAASQSRIPAYGHHEENTSSSHARTMASLQSGVVRVYGGRIGDQRGYATGVSVSADGEVVTTLSLLLEASDIRVVTSAGDVHGARIVYRDLVRQLALLKLREVETTDAVQSIVGEPPAAKGGAAHAVVPLDESRAPTVGDVVFVVGNPFKIAEGDEACSVGRGVVSGRIRLDARQPRGGEPVAYRGEVFLMDAMASNPGSPGSAVFDLDGRWIGLVGEVVESRLTNTLLNYAFPASEIAAFLREARSTGESPTASTATAPGVGYHGIRLSRIGYRAKLPFVETVAKGSPADRAGVRSGDLVLSVNGTGTPKSATFDEVSQRLLVGDEMLLVVKRGEQIMTLRFTLGERAR